MDSWGNFGLIIIEKNPQNNKTFQDEKKCLKVKNAIDAKVVLGNGASQRILQQIDMASIDYFLALTSLDEINLIALYNR